jgi:hypothetical protein
MRLLAWPAYRPYLHNLPPSKLASNEKKKKRLEAQEGGLKKNPLPPA